MSQAKPQPEEQRSEIAYNAETKPGKHTGANGAQANALPSASSESNDVEAVLPRATAQAERWRQIEETNPSTKKLADMVHDPNGVGFTFAFVDRVARPEDNSVAAREFGKLANPFKRNDARPAFLGALDSILVAAGSIAAPIAPKLVMPVARAYLRHTVGHLVLDANSASLNTLLDNSRAEGFTLNLNLLGEAVLGEQEASQRANDIIELLHNPRVEYVSVKASAIVSQLNHWDFEGSLERLKARLRPIYRAALKRSPHPFINLDMEEYKDLQLTIRLFTELLAEEEFLPLRAGIVLQAYLPDTFDALRELADFAQRRRELGGESIKVRLVKGANLSMERVDAEIHDWPQAPYLTKEEVDANYVRLIDWALRPEHAENLRIGVASHNLYHVALAHELAAHRGVTHQLDIEMLQGMAPSQAAAVREVVSNLILYTPVVKPEDFDVAISYLVRRLEENGAKQNFLHALFAPDEQDASGVTPMDRQRERFEASVRDRWSTFAGPRRTQDRRAEAKQAAGCRSEGGPGHFTNEPDTDPCLRANREWAASLVAPSANPGPAQTPMLTDPAAVDAVVQRCRDAAEQWSRTAGAQRANVLDAVADALANHRGELISAAVFEAGKTVAEADPEVSEAIDFARYYAESARALDRPTGSVFTPYKVVLVTPPWNFPIAIPVGSCLAALAAGACVVLKPAPQALRVAEVFVDCMREAGVTEDMLQLVHTDEAEAGKALVSHEQVDSVILTGASETAKLFRSWRPRMTINAETSGKNALIVTPAADPDLAAADALKSAFGHAGQKCSAASLIITVGSMGTSERFKQQLVDAVQSIQVGPGHELSTWMNGLIESPGEKLLRGLTTLEPGERWLVQPRQLNEEGTLWSPGLRDNVQPGSWFHTHECFGPVAGIMHAETLEEAIAWQNATGYGLTGGIHSLDPEEVQLWLDRVEVGNAYVRRSITGAIVQRQSFGGWKQSSVGSGAKAGGPNYVAQQGRWSEGNLAELPGTSPSPEIMRLMRSFTKLSGYSLSAADESWLRAAAASDAHAWATEFGVEHDATALAVESNVFRYRRLLGPLMVRFGKGTQARDVLRLRLASARTGTPLDCSATPEVQAALGDLGLPIRAVDDEAFARTVRMAASPRVRALGTTADSLYEAAAAAGGVVLDQPVLPDGRRELLPFLLEQAVSTTLHRFGYLEGTEL